MKGGSAYETIGEAKVRAVLQALYDRMFVDPIVGFLFEGKDKAHIVEAQVALTCAFLGGPQRYTGKPLPEAHASLPLLPGHFDRRHHLLARVMVELAVPEEVRTVWLQVDAGLRGSVLAAGEEARAKSREPEG
ncbi:MAG TPA: group 1 truncated hemoglobin [Polyangiaceae bacterium]|jgi:truncated hemoglobin YjbI